MDRSVPQLSLAQRRERAVATLCEAFADDRLELPEFERRLDLAHRSATAAELDALVQDLPAAAASSAPPASHTRDTLARGTRVVREAMRDSRTFLAFMGGVERRGNWVPARRNVVVAIMGGAELDFRDVELPPGETEVFLFCMMGGAEIIVPPHLKVDASGIAIMGGFGHASSAGPSDPQTPVLRINGFCLMGGVDISVRHSGESPKDARLREREEQRRQRDERKRLRDGE